MHDLPFTQPQPSGVKRWKTNSFNRTVALKTKTQHVLCLIYALGFFIGTVRAQTLTQEFTDAGYTLTDLGSVVGVPANYGGIAIRPEQPNVLYLGGAANQGSGAIYTVPLERDSTTNRIIGFDYAQYYVAAANVDGGIVFTPESTLLFTRYSNNAIGQVLPDSTSLSTSLSSFGVSSSVGSCTIVPNGYPGAGNFIVSSYNASRLYRLPFTVLPSGEYSFASSTADVSVSGTASGPEGIAYVPEGSQGFTAPSVLVSAYDAGRVVAFEVDSIGLPVDTTARDVVTGLTGAEGAVIDPVTGDFLFSTFGGGNRIIRVSGFSVPTQIRQPANDQGDLTVFPNPFDQKLTLQLQHPHQNLQVKMLDATGRTVATTSRQLATKLELDTATLLGGWYTLLMVSDRAVWRKKVFKP